MGKVMGVDKLEIRKDLMTGSPPVAHMTRLMVLDMVKFHKVKIFTNTQLSEISNDGVVIEVDSSEKENLQVDTLVISLGLSPNRKLYYDLLGRTPNLYLIGDAREARNVMGAIWDAYEVANTV